jgi:YHS domain-containing protein
MEDDVRRVLFALAPAAVGLALVVLAGCSPDGSTQSPAQQGNGQAQTHQQHAKPAEDDHAHKPGQFGGIIVPIGSDSYHAEAVFEKGGVLRLYTLGKDESKVLEVEVQTLSAYAKPDGGTESQPFELKPQPQPGDKPGTTSLFVGTLPKDLWGKSVEVTVVNLKIGGERFRLGFKSSPQGHAAADMPAKRTDGEEAKLYLTPGGKYTEADIKANGKLTASRKFKGVKAEHNLNPRPGEPICPVTLTKASPKFTWVIDGKPYQFCCPPCVDEFVQLAKEKPDEVKEPSEYVQK